MSLVSLKHLVLLRLGGYKQSHVAGQTYTGGLDNLQRSPQAETLLSRPRIFIALELHIYSFSERNGYGGEPPVVRGVGESIKQTLVLGLDAREQGVS